MEEIKPRTWITILKIIRKWFIRITLGFVSVLLILILLAYIFEDKIKRYALEKINAHLTTAIQVKEIDFTFIRHFPCASLEFKEVLIQDPPGLDKAQDTFLYAKKIYLDFSIWDVLSGNYDVSKVGMEQGVVNIYIDKQGNENYHIWKSSGQQGNDKFQFKLKEMLFHNTKLSYLSKINHQDYAFDVEKLRMSGNFTEKQFELKADSKMKIARMKSGNLHLLRDKKSRLKTTLIVDKEQSKVMLRQGDLQIENLNFTIDGSVSETEEGSDCDLAVTGNSIDIVSLLNTFPEVIGDDLKDYETEGELKFSSTVTGIASKTKSPVFDAVFSIEKGNLLEKQSSASIKNLRLQGSFSSHNSQGKPELNIKELSGEFQDGKFKGNLLLSDFNQPHISTTLRGDFNMKNLQQFFKLKEFESAGGLLAIGASLKCILTKTEENNNWDLDIQQAEGKVSVNKMTLKIKDHPVAYRDFSGKFILKNDNAVVEDLKGYMGKTDIALNGALQNLLPFVLLKGQKLNIAADFYSSLLDLDDLLSAYEGEAKEQDTTQNKLIFPEQINFNFDARIKQVKYNTFNAKNISGNFKLIDRVFTAKNIAMQFAGGNCEGELSLDGRNTEELLVQTSVELQSMSVSEMFRLFKDFGQEIVHDDQISGTLTAKVAFSAPMDAYLKIEDRKIVSVAEIKLEGGELNEIKYFKDIAQYLRTEKKLRLFIGENNIEDLEKRLLHIQFAELSNIIEVKDGKVIIPEMDIANSVMTIHVYGTHGFDEQVDYHFNFRFKELKADHSETEYGTIVDDGSGFKVYIHMFGNINDPQFSWDGKERKADRKEYNKQEVLNTKAILQKEFGLFKKDTTLKMKETPDEEVKFLLDWDNGEKSTQSENSDKQKEKKKKDNNDRMNKLKKKLGVEEEKTQKEFEIEQ